MATLTYEQIPDASSFNASAMLGLPRAEYEREAEGPYQPYAGFRLTLEEKFLEAEQTFNEIIQKADSPNVWLAQMELGSMLSTLEGREDEGRFILVQAVGAPFLDVAANAAWNISELLKHNGHEAKAKGYSALAVGLHNSLAMVVVAERLAEAGLEDEALAAFEFASEHTTRIDHYRARIELGLARNRTSGVNKHAADVFINGLGSLTGEDFAASTIYVNTLAMYNSEVGSAAIATNYFDDCEDQCYFEAIQIDCKACGRSPKNYISVPSGDGDGTYPVFNLFNSESKSLGAITIFRGLMEDLIQDGIVQTNSTYSPAAIGPSGRWAQFLGSGSPIVLGEINVDAQMIFSDGSKCSNDADLAVWIDAEPDTYSVICWLSAPNPGDKTIRPLALAAVRGDLRDALLAVVEAPSLEEVNDLRKELWGGDFTVSAHIGDVRHGLALSNFHMTSGSVDDSLSWLLQQAEFRDEGLFNMIRAQDLPNDLDLRYLLARRGMFEPKLPWFDRNSQPAQASSTGLTKTGGGGLGGGGLGGSGLRGVQSESPASLAKFCVSCGTRFEGDQQKFCGNCGTAR
jgi:hypothetical protein